MNPLKHFIHDKWSRDSEESEDMARYMRYGESVDEDINKEEKERHHDRSIHHRGRV